MLNNTAGPTKSASSSWSPTWCNCRGGVRRGDHCHLTAYQIGCEIRQSIVSVLRPAILHRHILALDVAAFLHALPECGHKACSAGKRRTAEKPDHWHRRLLSAPSNGHAAAAPPR